MQISSSNNIDVVDSSFIGSLAFGVNVWSASDVTFDGIFVADVQSRDWTALDQEVDYEACVAFCSFGQCSTTSIVNSVAAGCQYAGFVAPGHDCFDTSSTKFKDNTAHSIDGVGAFIYPDENEPDHGTCYEGSHFTAYKC